jgi:hypothetical protein
MRGFETVVVSEAASAVKFCSGMLTPENTNAAAEHNERTALIALLFISITP